MKQDESNRILPVLLLTFLAVATLGFSQDKRVEISPFFGYSLSDGVTIDPLRVGGEVYDGVDVSDGVAYGFQVGVCVTENAEVGFLWSRQERKLAGTGTNGIDFTNMPVYNYHGVFTYNFGDSVLRARPFVFGGVGATHYGPEAVMGISFDGETRLSSTWGGGSRSTRPRGSASP